MKHLKLFESKDYFSSHDYIICPYCQKQQTEEPYHIVKWGIVNCDCEYCQKEFQVEKEVIYHSSKIGTNWDSRKTG